MMELRGLEFLDRRILAAIRFADVFGRPVREPVTVRSDVKLRHFRKPGGEIIITGAPGLEAYTSAFAAPPAAPAVGSVPVVLDLHPAARGLSPRRAVLDLPRDPSPEAAASVFKPVLMVLLPSVAAEPAGLAAGLHVTVRRKTDGHLVEGALVRVRVDNLPQAIAVTNSSGEARVLIPGVPLASPGPNTSVLPDIAAEVDTIVVPANARFHDPADAEALSAARRAEASRTTGFADPDALTKLAAQASAATTVRVAANEIRTTSIEWTPS